MAGHLQTKTVNVEPASVNASRQTSSVYSRDIDGNTLCSPVLPQTHSSRIFSRGNSLDLMPSPTSSSDRAPSSSTEQVPSLSSATTATSATLDTQPVTPPAEKSPPSRRLFSIIRDNFRTPSIIAGPWLMSQKSIGKERAAGDDELQDSKPTPQRRNPAIPQEVKQQKEQDSHRRFMTIIELGKLRRRIRALDFELAEKILLASDLTTLVPIPGESSSARNMNVGDSAFAQTEDQNRFFRERLAKIVHQRMTLLRLEVRHGSVRAIEDWYRGVVDLVGWRDQEEEELPWSWRENDGRF